MADPKGIILTPGAFAKTKQVVNAALMGRNPNGAPPREGPRRQWVAEITKVISETGKEGFYEAKQVIVDDEGKFTKLENALEWKEDNSVGLLSELNLNKDVTVGTVVRVFLQFFPEGGHRPVFEASLGGGGGEQVDKSVTFDKGKIVFENDLKLNAGAARPFDNEVEADLKKELGIPIKGPPAHLGSATDDEGPVLYGGMEDGEGSYGITAMRQYRYLSNQNKLDDSYLQPHDQGDEAHTDSNKSWIRLVDNFGRNGKMIKHGVLPQGREAIAAWMFPNAPAAGLAFIDWTAFNALPAGTITKAQFLTVMKQAYIDKLGHVYKLDSSYGDDDSDDDPYDPDNPDKPSGVDLTLEVSGYPISGSLFNVSITQSTKITDQAGVTTTLQNGPNALQYTLEDGDGNVAEVNFPDFSTLSSVKGNAEGFN